MLLAPVQAYVVVYQNSKRFQMSYLGRKWKKTGTKVGFRSVLLVLLVLRQTKEVLLKNSQFFVLKAMGTLFLFWFQSLKSRRLDLSKHARLYTNYHRVPHVYHTLAYYYFIIIFLQLKNCRNRRKIHIRNN